jgi:long-chain acyl-CoA synthetase
VERMMGSEAGGGDIVSGERVLARGDLFDRASRATAGFASLGVGPGDAIALMLRNDFPFFEASFGVGRLGGHAVPINWHFQADEARHILQDSGAKAIVVHTDLLPQISEAIPDDLPLLLVDTPHELVDAYGIDTAALDASLDRRHGVEWDGWVRSFEPWAEPPKPSPGSMIYTSGTTGNPKGVKRKPATGEQLTIGARIGMDLYGFKPSARGVLTGPLYHIAPNTFGLYLAAAGDLLVMQPRFDPRELLAMIDEYRITTLNVVPTMFVRLLEIPEDERAQYDLSSLERVVHNAAPCPIPVKKAMIEWWGPVIHELYGGTESGPATACNSDEWLAHPGTVGRAVEGVAIHILDIDGRRLAPGETGEVYVESTINSEFTYHGRADERADIEHEGLITLGDVGHLDEDGYLYLSDRKKDMIISGGVNIYPAEIEAALISIEAVADCAVFGIPHDEFGEVPHAVVQVRDGHTADAAAIRSELIEHLAKYKVPRTIDFVDELPREDTGKIYKRRLRDPHWVGHDSNI